MNGTEHGITASFDHLEKANSVAGASDVSFELLTKRPSSFLGPHKAKIDVLLVEYPEVSAVRIHEKIARGTDGYTGSVCTVRRYLGKIHPARGRVYQEVHYEPD